MTILSMSKKEAKTEDKGNDNWEQGNEDKRFLKSEINFLKIFDVECNINGGVC